MTFTIPTEKEVARIDKNGEEITKSIRYTLQFIGSARFMPTSLSNLVNNLSEGIHQLNVNTDTMIKNVKLVELHTKYATVFQNIKTLKTI